MDIILASASPRRKEILSDLVKDFKVIVSQVDENISKEDPKELAMELARRKAWAVFKDHPDDLVIGADTVVYHDGKIFGKPKDANEAFEVLRELCGNTHQVITGVCIRTKDEESVFCDTTDVTFGSPSDEEIMAYIASKDPFDKAGGYGIQNLPKSFRATTKGSFTNVIGLPAEKVKLELDKYN